MLLGKNKLEDINPSFFCSKKWDLSVLVFSSISYYKLKKMKMKKENFFKEIEEIRFKYPGKL
mgnify:CR=1 FL=1